MRDLIRLIRARRRSRMVAACCLGVGNDVAVCCSRASFSSQANQPTSVYSRVGDELERGTAFGALRRFGSGVFRRRSLIGHAVKGSGERNYLRGLDRLEQGVGSATLGVSLRHWIDLQGRSECLGLMRYS